MVNARKKSSEFLSSQGRDFISSDLFMQHGGCPWLGNCPPLNFQKHVILPVCSASHISHLNVARDLTLI
ncbi:MAG: hypothetical protein D5R98_06745 [Desulfonatronovibrio sp. MSAO_Bac4]|nr:MAG: hypothetical protein D5R98_06745 [Desulfonatronovibrio sp. MSAO_Bac4]